MSATVDLFTRPGAVCGQFVCGDGTVSGDPGDFYTLPPAMVVLDDTQASRFRENPQLLAHGEQIDGNFVDVRDFDVQGLVLSGDEPTQRALLREILQKAFQSDLKLRYDSDAFLNVARAKKMGRTHKAMKGKTLTQVDLSFRCADPFWYALTWDSYQIAVGGTDTTSFTVDVDPDVAPDVNPIIWVLAPAVGYVPSFTLTNTSDVGDNGSARWLTYADPGLANGSQVFIDCRTWTVTRDGNNTISYVSGYPLRLLPGTNAMIYAGPAATLTLFWQSRYL